MNAASGKTVFVAGVADMLKKLVLAMFLLVSAGSVAETVDRIVAKVGTDVITLSDRQAYLKYKKLDFEFRHGSGAAGQFAAWQARATEDMVLDRLLDQELEREKISISPSAVDTEYRAVLKRIGLDEAGFVKKLSAGAVSLAEYKSHLRRALGKQEFIQKKIMPRVSVSEIDIKKEYNANSGRYRTYNKIRFIEAFMMADKFTDDESLVEFVKDLHQKLERGQNVSSLIRQQSSGVFAAKGGDSGLVDATQLRPEVLNVLMRLKPGQVSPPIPFGEGVFLFKLLSQSEPVTIPYNQVSQQVKADVAEKVVGQEFTRYLMALKDQTYVKVMP